MKVVAFNGSPRKDGNTATLIQRVFGELEKTGIETVTSNPLKPLLTEVPEDQTELTGFSAAFTTCFGLALRALED